MKRGIIILTLILLILPTILAEVPISLDPNQPVAENFKLPPTTQPKPSTNIWNETIIISDTWQQLIGTFFGLNLKNVSTEISVRETIVLILVFIMFLMIILDIIGLTPFFKTKIGPISSEFLASIIITVLVSISGAFINLKDLLLNAISYTITSLDWEWLTYLTQNKIPGIIITIFMVIPILFIIHEIFSVIKPIIEKYSKVSRAEAKGRLLNSKIDDTNI